MRFLYFQPIEFSNIGQYTSLRNQLPGTFPESFEECQQKSKTKTKVVVLFLIKTSQRFSLYSIQISKKHKLTMCLT